MMCYKDKTFCGSDCVNDDCHRFVSEGLLTDSLEWTKTFKPDAKFGILALSDFSDTCNEYKEPNQ